MSQTFFSSGTLRIAGFLMFASGTSIKINGLGSVIKRCAPTTIAKLAIGFAFGFAFIYFFGVEGVLGINGVAFVSVICVCNPGVYMGCIQDYGEPEDLGNFAILNVLTTPAIPMLIIATASGSGFNILEIVSVLVPFLFAYLDERQAVVIIHPSAPEVVPQNVFTSVTKPLFEYIADTTRAVLNLIATGAIEKYLHIKIVVPHAGSFLPLLAQRLVGISRILIPKGIMQPCDVAKSLDMLYFDIAGDVLPVWLDALKKVANPEHVMCGGDFPYTPAPQIIAKNKDLAACDSLAGWYEEVMHLNAEKLFGLR